MFGPGPAILDRCPPVIAEPLPASEQAEQGLTTYTVVGLWLGSAPVAAAVLEGSLNPVDAQPPGELVRWATSVEASSPLAAEHEAVEQMRGVE